MSTNNNANNFIQINGIMSQGYGFSPKAVMRDTRLTIEAKAIYAYMSSFAGAGLNSFPSVKLQLSELCISEKRYYKHRKLLEDLGYITIKQTRTKLESGKVVNDKNIYTLEQFPTPKPKEEIQKDMEAVFERFPILKERKDQDAQTLSGGEQQMLAMGRALMSRPKLLLLDEPSMGLAPIFIREIFKIIQEIQKTGTTVLLIEQNAKMALSISNRAYVLETGSVVLSGTGQELLESDEIQKAYLGG